jgi:ComF family protein
MRPAAVLRALLDVVYPRRCAGCAAGGWPFCERCRIELVRLSPPWCPRCGRPRDASAPVPCGDCPPPPIAWARAPFLYEGPARQALIRLKFGGQRSLAESLTPAIASVLTLAPPAGWEARPFVRAPVVTWVPLGRRRRRDRGFDQAEVLARSVAAGLEVPIRPLLRRVVETSPQARRSGEERRLALAGAFEAREAPPERVVLVDDVLTTGATAAACAGVLVDAGAVEVGVLAAARSLNGRLPARCYAPAVLPPGSVVARGIDPR